MKRFAPVLAALLLAPFLLWRDREGLWLCAPGQGPKLIVEGEYSEPLVTPDGNHLVAVRGHRPGVLVRIDIHKTEHVLLDPASGKLEVVKGEFELLMRQNSRPLQPVAGSREYWAAVPDSEKNLTRVGRYDARTFRFKPLMEIPEIYFTSEMMWVDDAAQRIYLAYNGHLLRLPLAVDQKSSGK